MKRILLVDDEPNVRLAFRMTLEASGYEVSEASTASDAIAQLLQDLFQLAVVDLRMPGMDGLQLLESARDEGIATPVIIVTAFSNVPDAVKAMKLGAIDFVLKPLRPDDLRSLVNQVAERHSTYRDHLELDDFATHLRAAKRFINLRHFESARIHLNRAVELNHRSAEAFNLAGVLAEVMDDVSKARKYYGQAIRIDHNFAPAQQNMRRLFAIDHFGRTEEAINLGAD